MKNTTVAPTNQAFPAKKILNISGSNKMSNGIESIRNIGKIRENYFEIKRARMYRAPIIFNPHPNGIQ